MPAKGVLKPRKDITGARFGRLVVLSYLGLSTWKCQCDCGNTATAPSTALNKGAQVSCGCYAREAYAKRCVEVLPKINTKLPGESGFSRLLYSYQWNAKKRGLSFELSIDEFRALTKGNCFYCNEPPSQVIYQAAPKSEKAKQQTAYVYSGIDRKVNSIGYTLDNTVPCCHRCNTAKWDVDVEPFLQWIEQVYVNRLLRKNETTDPVQAE